MTSGKADLHTHTTASDGLHPPAYNVQMAKQLGLDAIAITDHDTVAGLASAMEAGAKHHIEVIPGVEMSTLMNGQDVHILGYFIDWSDELFLDRLEQQRKTRTKRNHMMIERLRELKIDISYEEVVEASERQDNEDSIGRPHIADVLVSKGIVSSMAEAFDIYLGKGGKAYINPQRILPYDAIRWIREAGGKAVIAHPGLYHDDGMVREIISRGVDGIEVFHSDHSPEEEEQYLALAQAHGLIVTAGSDFHGKRQGDVFHGPIGNRTIGTETLNQLKAN